MMLLVWSGLVLAMMTNDPTMANDHNVILVKRSPLDLGSNSRQKTSNSNSNKKNGYTFHDNNSGGSNNATNKWVSNPVEYTIGGVLSGAPGIDHYFRQVLSVSVFWSFYFLP
jgi:hypothetical protein